MSEHMRRFDNSKWQANPLIKMEITEDDPRRNMENAIKRANRPAVMSKRPPKPTMKQYGDKGYKPSNGMGVGY